MKIIHWATNKPKEKHKQCDRVNNKYFLRQWGIKGLTDIRLREVSLLKRGATIAVALSELTVATFSFQVPFATYSAQVAHQREGKAMLRMARDVIQIEEY